MEPPPNLRALIVAGPTCSGKSALALDLACHLGGVIVNADAMQVYRELRVLTARPTPADEARAPHALYGVRPAAEPGNAAWWRAAALDVMDDVAGQGRVPILCGGSGLYLAALLQGLSALPAIDDATRTEARALLAAKGPAALHARLSAVDPVTAARLRPTDSQRLARAWEVWRATGRGLADWQAQAATDQSGWRFAAIHLDPPRAELRHAIAARAAAIVAGGAVAEVRALLDLGLDPALPAMRAHGVPELSAHLRGAMTLAAARTRIALMTGQYAKRQATWLRHHSLAEPTLTHVIHARYASSAQFSQSIHPAMISFVRATG